MEAFANKLIPQQMEKYHIAGVELSVVRDGTVLFEKGYGVYNKAMNKEVSAQDTLFRIGSISKLFIWTSIMQLVQEGKIDLDMDINTYLKTFQIPDTFGKPITIRNLMTHTAGFEDRLTNLFSSSDSKLIPLDTYLKETILARIYAPGERIAYSNYGASLAALIVEQVSGMDYSDYIQEHILDPLEMSHTTLEQPVPEEFSNQVSFGFTYRNGTYKGTPDAMIQMAPSGAISSTADDMAKFMIMHLQNGRYGNIRILNENISNEMQSRQYASDSSLPGMCLGFMEWLRNDKRIIWHSGGTQLFKSLFMLIPAENTGVFISYNTPNSEDARADFRSEFLNRYYPYMVSSPQAMKGYKERAKRYKGSYIESRTALRNSDKIIFALSRVQKVKVNKDGSITFRNTRYVEVEPLHFKEIDGQGILIFRENEQGEVTDAYQDYEPHETYCKLPWYKTIDVQISILLLCILTFIVLLFGWVIIGKQKKSSWYQKDQKRLIYGRKLLWWACLLNLMFPIMIVLGVVFDLLIGSKTVLLGNFPLLSKLSLFPPVIAAILTLIALIYMIYSWKNKIWSITFRLQYTFVLLICLIYTEWFDTWNVVLY
jgi:CubicO group peptidase (beta-lactamase class C family)